MNPVHRLGEAIPSIFGGLALGTELAIGESKRDTHSNGEMTMANKKTKHFFEVQRRDSHGYHHVEIVIHREEGSWGSTRLATIGWQRDPTGGAWYAMRVLVNGSFYDVEAASRALRAVRARAEKADLDLHDLQPEALAANMPYPRRALDRRTNEWCDPEDLPGSEVHGYMIWRNGSNSKTILARDLTDAREQALAYAGSKLGNGASDAWIEWIQAPDVRLLSGYWLDNWDPEDERRSIEEILK